MPLNVRVEPRAGYLHVSVSGENTRENVAAYLEAVRAAGEASNCRRVLIEENLEGPSLGVAEMYGVIASAVSAARISFEAVGYVDVNPGHDAGRLKFAETVAVNRSLRVRIFPSAAEAARWLEEGAP